MMPPLRLAAAALTAIAVTASPAGAAAAPAPRLTRWSSTVEFNHAKRVRVTTADGALQLAPGATSGRWRSPWMRPGFGVQTVVPSWSITTPAGTWVRIELRARRGTAVGTWHTMATWATGTESVRRSSSEAHPDDVSTADVDTLRSRGAAFGAWRLRVTLLRAPGITASPRVASLSVVAAAYATKAAPTSATTMRSTTVLDVPAYSQEIHQGEYPQFGGGGEAWCSPTTAIMLLRYRNLGPSPTDYSFANRYADPWVDHAAVQTYDYHYERTGNWSFTMGYAGQYADAYVTRFANLRRVERLIRAGTPVGAAIAYGSGQLSGAPVRSSAGHLLAIVGFTSDGDVVVNDPAASSNSRVRRTYDRAQFEQAWLAGSGGIAYVVRP